MPRHRRPTDATQLEQLVQALAQLSHSEKQELLALLQAMLEADEQESNEHTLKQRHQYREPKGGGGYYERKLINGRGPYLYLRYWSGGKHRSVFREIAVGG